MRPPAALFLLAALLPPTAQATLTPDEQRQSARYAQILRDDPTHLVARQRLWALHATAGDPAALLADYAARAPTSLPGALIHAYLLLESGDPTAALVALDRATTNFPNSPRPLLAKAELLTAQDADPVPPLEAALALAPEDPTIAERLTRARLAAGDTTATQAAPPTDPTLRRELADQLLAANFPADARPHLTWLTTRGDPTQRLEALRTLSELDEQSGDLPAAIKSTNQALALLGPNHWLRPDLESRLTNLQARAGTLPDRLTTLRASAEKSPRDWRTWREIATIERTLGHPAKQIDALTRALAAAPTDANLRRELATAESDFGDLDHATALVDELIATAPNDPDLHFLRADLDLRANNLEAARERIAPLVAADPTLRPRATAFYESNRLPAAARALWTEAAAEGDPTASLKLATAQLEADNLPAALATLEKATLDAESNLRAASLLRSHDHVAESIHFLEAADTLEATQQLAAALVATGKIDQAISTLETALTAYPADAAILDRQIYDTLAADPEALTTYLATLSPDRLARWQIWTDATEPDESRPLVPDAAMLDDLAVAAEKAPASVDALVDLAAARQAAGDYFAALEAWTDAFARAPANERTALLAPILATTARLQLPDRGLGFLVDYALSRTTETDRTAAWLDAVTFAEKNSRLDLLEASLATAPDDHPTAVALAALSTARGDDTTAFNTLESHTRLAADEPAALARTLAAATRTGDSSAVIRSAARLTAATDEFPAWQQAATALEAVGATDTANATWDALRRKFNRDPAALTAAASYYQRTGNPEAHAAAIYAAATLDPSDPTRLAEAANLADRLGDRDRAIEFDYQILAATEPLIPDPSRFPGFDEVSADVTNAAHSLAMRAIGGLADTFSVAAVRATAENPATPEARLPAIRDLARLATGGTSREKWLAWCAAATPFEAAWGFYAAAEFAPAHAALLSLLATTDNPAPVERALIWNALRRSSFDTLRAWINSDPTIRRRRTELLFLGLSRLLATHTYALTPEQIEALFPRSDVTPVERWRAAWLFSSHARLEDALQLAQDSGKFPSDQQIAETQLASWHILLGQRNQARATLAPTLSLPAVALDSPAIVAFRLDWLLSTPAQRSALVQTIAHEDVTRSALAQALSNDTESLPEAAGQLVQKWMATSASTGVRPPFSSLVRNGVTQLHTWNLPRLALAICEAAADTEALVAAQSGDGSAWRTELAGLEAASRLMLAAPRETEFVVNDLKSRNFDFQAWATLARRLDAAGYAAAALAVRDELLSRRPDEPATINERAISAAAAKDLPLQAELLERTLSSGRLGSNFPAIVSQTEELATLRFELNDPAAALPFIDRVLELAPADPRLVDLKDQTLERLGRTAKRREFWSRQIKIDPITGTLGRARFLVDVGEPAKAITALRQALNARPANATEIRDLLYQTEARHGDRNAAIAELRRLAATDRWEAVGHLAPAIAESGDPAPVATVLRQGLSSAANPRVRFACGRILLKLRGQTPALDALRSDLGQMRRAAEADPELIPKLYETGAEIATASPLFATWFTDQMRDEWRDGAGPTLAGQQLIALGTADLSALLDQLLIARHYDDESWTRIATKLAADGHARGAARVYHELAKFAPDQPGFTFLEATQLWLAGERSAAIGLVEAWIAIRDFDPSIRRQAADFFRDIERPARAAALYAEIVENDVAVRHPEAWIELAKLSQQFRDFGSAKLFLLSAFQSPTTLDWAAIADFIAARGDLTSLDPTVNEFQLRPDLHQNVRLAIARKLVALGSYARALEWIDPASLPNEQAADLLQQIAERGDLIEPVTAFWNDAISELPENAQLATQRASFIERFAKSNDRSQ